VVEEQRYNWTKGDQTPKLMLIVSLLPLLVIGLIEVGLAIPMILHRVPPNVWYGFRTAKTLADKEIWYPANAFAGKLLLVTGILALILAGILWWLHPRISFVVIEVVSLAGILVPLGVALGINLLYLSRL